MIIISSCSSSSINKERKKIHWLINEGLASLKFTEKGKIFTYGLSLTFPFNYFKS